MRLGFVGVGRHAQRMARCFLECGAEVVAYDRASRSEPAELAAAIGWGRRERWEDMITSPDIDAIVCCAPPAVTVEVALSCAFHGKRCCATKPLKITDEVGDAPFSPAVYASLYVDLWRLYSPAWVALRDELLGRTISAVHVDFYGNGPKRPTHSGLLDYGPHALAFVLDLGLKPELRWTQPEPGKWAVGSYPEYPGSNGVSVLTGNGFASSVSYIRVETTDGGQYVWHERDSMQTFYAGGAVLVQNYTEQALRNFCRAFMRGGTSETLRISCEAMRLLKGAS